MSKDRVIYQSLALMVSQNGITGDHTGVNSIKQVPKVISFDDGFSRSFEDVVVYGRLGAIDRIETEPPTVNGSFEYYVTDGSAERYLGLTVATGNQSFVSCVSGIARRVTDSKNYFLMVVDEGSDAVGYASPVTGAVALGNGFITSYTVQGAVGEIPSASIELEALNWVLYASLDGTDDVPAINPSNGLQVAGIPFLLPYATESANASEPKALQPKDIFVTIGDTFGFASADLLIQNFSLSVELTRSPQNGLGRFYPKSRNIEFPLTATLSVEAEFGDIVNANLADKLCETGTVDCSVVIRRPACNGTGTPAIRWDLKGAKMVNNNLSTAVGQNSTVTFEFEVPISGPEDVTRGIGVSGSFPA